MAEIIIRDDEGAETVIPFNKFLLYEEKMPSDQWVVGAHERWMFALKNLPPGDTRTAINQDMENEMLLGYFLTQAGVCDRCDRVLLVQKIPAEPGATCYECWGKEQQSSA